MENQPPHTTDQADSQNDSQNDSLESGGSNTVVTPVPSGDSTVPSAPSDPTPAAPKRKAKRLHLNIYLLLFVLVIIISVAIVIITAKSRSQQSSATVKSQSISSQTLKQLASSDATVGDPKQVLSVQSNAIFAGKVLVRNDLDVAGTINVAGSLALGGITVGGQSVFDTVQISKNLTVSGDTALQGAVTIKKNLSVNGNGTFSGPVSTPQLTANQLQIAGDLTLTNHLVAGGATPGRSNGTALGNGGTAGVSGSDSAGSININTGSSPAAGCFMTVNFSKKYNSTPRVLLTAASAAAAGTSYYVSRTTSGFSVCSSVVPPANSSLVFDYFIVG